MIFQNISPSFLYKYGMSTAFSWDKIVERGKQHNRTVICEVEKRQGVRYFNVKCDICGDEKQSLLSGFENCLTCSSNKYRRSIEEFINIAKNIHGDKYNYDLVQYVNKKTKVNILCNTCNELFLQRPFSHLKGQGCKTCAYIHCRYNTDTYIEKALNIFSERYNYDLVEYVNSTTKIKIKCNICLETFEQLPCDHLQGHGCRKCSIKHVSEQHKSNTEEFIIKAKIKHGDKFNYDLVQYVSVMTKVKILCNKCKNLFEQIPNNHLFGQGCPKCNESKGENRVAKYLSHKNIRYIKNKIFDTLRDKSYLKPDFYLPELKLLIEYDGAGHYIPIYGKTPEQKQQNFEDCQRRDKIKDEWARKNNIPLLRIPYWDFDRIPELIEDFILEHTSPKEIKQLSLEI